MWIFIVLGLGIGVVLALAGIRALRRPDLGCVSPQWVVEHRSDERGPLN